MLRLGHFLSLFVCILLSSLLGGSAARADDWPQWLGPKRDSVWNEAGVVQSVPAKGLKTQWRVPVGLGYSSPSVVDGVIYLTDFLPEDETKSDNPGKAIKTKGTERVRAIDGKTGKVLWTHSYPEKYTISYPGGPRVAPTVVSGQLFTVGAQGRFTALDAKTGTLLWEKDLNKEYGIRPPTWGYASHPLVDGDLVYTAVGGDGTTAMAFDRNTGKEVWRALSASDPGYCPPTMIEHQGKKQVLFWHGRSLNSLDPETGKRNWSVEIAPDHGMAITPPRIEGDLLYLSGAPKQAVVLKLKGDKQPEELWRGLKRDGIYSANVTPFVHDGTVYGVDALTGEFRAIRLYDGEKLWSTFEPTTGERRAPYGTTFIVRNGKNGHFYLFNEKGDLIISRLSDKGYTEVGRTHLVDPTSLAFGRDVVWSHPAFADKSVFVRNDKELVRYDLSKDSYPDGGPKTVVETHKEEARKASIAEAGPHILTMSKFGLMAYFELMKDKEKAKQFTKNDLWTKVDVKTVHTDVFPSISYLYTYFPDNYAKALMGEKAKSGPSLAALTSLLGGKDKNITEWTKSDAFLDKMDEVLSKLEADYRKAAIAAKEKKDPKEDPFMPTKEKWYPTRTDKDPELWKTYSEVAALEYFLYRISNTDIDLMQKYKDEVSVRVRDKNSKKTLEYYFSWSKNPKRAIDLARRMARLEKDHAEKYGLYTPMRDLLVRFLSYQWEFHDLLLDELKDPKGAGAAKENEVHADK